VVFSDALANKLKISAVLNLKNSIKIKKRENMYTILDTTINTYEIKRSKFITYLTPIENFKELQVKLKKDNPKSNHLVYSMRYLNEFEQIVENSSDDAEPKGSAGVPSLNVLRGNELIECAILIVRYFGGIKLGVGGLARAYATATKEVIAISDLKLYKKEIEYKFTCSYSNIQKTLYHIKKLEIKNYQRNFGIDSVEWIVKANKDSIDKLIENL
jgi:uncharacterized YigZ family protein